MPAPDGAIRWCTLSQALISSTRSPSLRKSPDKGQNTPASVSKIATCALP